LSERRSSRGRACVQSAGVEIAIDVISADTRRDRRAPPAPVIRSGRCRSPPARHRSRPSADRSDVQQSLVVEPQRADFLERRVEQDERFAVGSMRSTLPGVPVPTMKVALLSKASAVTWVVFVL